MWQRLQWRFLFVLKRPRLLPLMPKKVPVPPASAFSKGELCKMLSVTSPIVQYCFAFFLLMPWEKNAIVFFSVFFSHHKMSPYWIDGQKIQAWTQMWWLIVLLEGQSIIQNMLFTLLRLELLLGFILSICEATPQDCILISHTVNLVLEVKLSHNSLLWVQVK